MKLTKKIIAIVMALMMTLSIGAVTANAATVHLTTSQGSNTSAKVYGNYKVFYGNNESYSAHSVYFIARHQQAGVWYTDKSKLVAKGNDCPVTETTVKKSERNWVLKLNPEGAGKTGCDAKGYIIND